MRIFTTILCALAGLAVFAGTASAQNCRPGVNGTRCQPVQVQPVHRGQAIYTYPTTYQYPTHEVVVKEVLTPVAVPVAVPVLIPAYQYTYVPACQPAAVAGMPNVPQPSAMPGMQQAGSGPMSDQEKLKQLARELLAEMQRQQGGGGDDGPPVAIDVGSPIVPPGQQAQNHVQVLTARCASCHTGPQSKGGVVLFNASGVLNPQADKQRAIRAVEDGRMPPQAVNDPKFRLTPQEVAAVRSWWN